MQIAEVFIGYWRKLKFLPVKQFPKIYPEDQYWYGTEFIALWVGTLIFGEAHLFITR